MAPAARSPEHHSTNVIELVQWLEDVAAAHTQARVVTLSGTDAARRTATLRAFYERIVRHPRFGRAWPATLPAGSLAPFFPPDRDDTPNGLMWFGFSCSREVVAEPAQFLTQFQACRAMTDHEEWMYELPHLAVEGTMASPPFENAADHADQAFGILGDPQGETSARMRTFARSLDTIVEGFPLLADGGVLEHDGPRLRARAMFAAAWLQRFARRTPVVVVIDEAQHAGQFLSELVRQLAAAPCPVLVVLSGTPVGTDAFVAASGDRLAGPLGRVAASTVPLLGLPAGDLGRVAGLLATAMPTTLFTRRHLEAATASCGAAQSPQQVLEALMAAGWARVVDEPVLAFTDDEHFFAARDGALTVFDDEIDATCVALCQQVAHATTCEHLLERTVALRAAAVWDAPQSAVVFETARLLALQGDLDGALALSGAAGNPLQHAVAAGWEQAVGRRRVVPEDFPAEQPYCPEALVVHAALLATFHPAAARAKLARAMERLGTNDADVDRSARLRFAAARVALQLGDLDNVDRALGEHGRDWLTERTRGELDRLDQWRWNRGLVRRTAQVLGNLVAIANVRHYLPQSVVLGHFLTQRLVLLDQLDRIAAVDDALVVADEAVTVFSRLRDERPIDQWGARRWRAVVRHRLGDTDSALRELDELAAEEGRVAGAHSLERLGTLTRKGRCLAEAARPQDAHDLLHDLCEVLADAPEAAAATLHEARHWHAETIISGGDFASAASELSGVVAWRAANLAPDDEDLLLSRHRYAFTTVRSGGAAIASAEMREVVERRAQLDLADSPRLLAARLSHGAYLVQLGCAEDALRELQEVVHHRAAALAPSDTALLDARAELGTCFLVLGRFAEAFDEIDVVVQAHQATSRNDFLSLVLRQQHALCLRELGRGAEADAELDALLQDCQVLPPDHPLVEHVRSLRNPLAGVGAS